MYTVFFSLASAEALWEKGWSEKGAKIHANKVDWIRVAVCLESPINTVLWNQQKSFQTT